MKTIFKHNKCESCEGCYHLNICESQEAIKERRKKEDTMENKTQYRRKSIGDKIIEIRESAMYKFWIKQGRTDNEAIGLVMNVQDDFKENNTKIIGILPKASSFRITNENGDIIHRVQNVQ